MHAQSFTGRRTVATHTSARSRLTTSRRLVVRAAQEPRDAVMQAPALAACAAAVAAVLISGPLAPGGSLLHPQAVRAESVAEEVYAQEAVIEEQKSMLEFSLQRQQNAERARILAQRQQLQTELGRVEAALQARLTQQRANVVGAQQVGDKKAAENATLAAEELEAKQAQILQAAGQLNSQLDRLDMLERARAAAARQNINRAANEVDGALNAGRLNPWLEAFGKK